MKVPSLTTFSDSFEFDLRQSIFPRDDYSDSDWEAREEETSDDTLQSLSKPINIPNQFRRLDTAPPLLSLVHINREMQLLRALSCVAEVTLTFA
jgi:hypothetical protein